jgi:molecular chaperone DnaK
MRNDAEQFAEEDRKQRDLAEARNDADTAIYATEKFLRDHGGDIADVMRQECEGKIKAARDILTSEDTDSIKQKTKDLLQILEQLGAAVNQPDTGSIGGGPTSTAEEPGQEGEVVDGEFKET